MVECESEAFTVYIQNHRVLIDTWWNVNVFTKADAAKQYIVLIDTWWNVNSSPAHLSARLLRF